MTRLLFALVALLATPAAAQTVDQVSRDVTAPAATKLIILLVVLCAGVFAMGRTRLPDVFRNVAIWALIFVGVLALYASRDQLVDVGRDVMAVLMPGTAFSNGEQVMVRRNLGGHFRLRGAVDGADVSFIFDTGASSVVLSAADAERAGFDTAALDYRLPVSTASGMTTVAPVRLGEVSVGSITVDNVRAAVARPGDLNASLLGMTFLDRLSGYEVRRDELILTP